MIVQRIAGVGSPALPARRADSFRERIGRAPATAGRERLKSLLEGSVLAQLIVAMALISCAALIYLNQASQVSILQFNIADLQHQQIQLRMQNADLYARATALQNLQRIENDAATQLHMSAPTYGSIVWIRPAVPVVPATPVDSASVQARSESQPIAWMKHALTFIGAQF